MENARGQGSLILTRGPGETILIEGGISIAIMELDKRGKARIAIKAPGRLILRAEIATPEQAEVLAKSDKP